jgi:hypothetical protein
MGADPQGLAFVFDGHKISIFFGDAAKSAILRDIVDFHASFVRINRLLGEIRGFALFQGQGAGRANPQTKTRPITEFFLDHPGFSVY